MPQATTASPTADHVTVVHVCVSPSLVNVSVLHEPWSQIVSPVSHRHLAVILWWAVRCVTAPDLESPHKTSPVTQTTASAGAKTMLSGVSVTGVPRGSMGFQTVDHVTAMRRELRKKCVTPSPDTAYARKMWRDLAVTGANWEHSTWTPLTLKAAPSVSALEPRTVARVLINAGMRSWICVVGCC